MDNLLIVLLVGMFLYGIIYMYRKYREIELYTYTTMLEKIVLFLAIGVFFFITYRYGHGLIAYILLIMASGFLILMVMTSGATSDGFIFMQGRGLSSIGLIKYEDFRVIKIKFKSNYIEVEAPSPKALAILKFRLEDRDSLLTLIKNNKIEIKE